MAYSTMANGGTSYYPRLVSKVLNQDGTPVLDGNGKIAVPEEPKVRADFRSEISPADIELERRGFWKVVNEDGGTGGQRPLEQRAGGGKTGTAQASFHGRKDTIAVVCWAPFEHPKYTIAVMVQGGGTAAASPAPLPENSGTVARPRRREVRHAESRGWRPRERIIHFK